MTSNSCSHLHRWSTRAIYLSAGFALLSIGFSSVVKSRAGLQGSTIECSAPSHDFGVAYAGDTVDHQFKLRNFGAVALTVEKVTASCGCTVISEDVTGKTIEPGGSLSIPVKFSTGGMDGLAKKPIRIQFEANPVPITLEIKGEIQSRIVKSPTAVIIARKAPSDQASGTITIKKRKGVPRFHIVEATSNSTFIKPSVQEKVIADDSDFDIEWEVSVLALSQSVSAPYRGAVFLRTDDEVMGTIVTSVEVISGPDHAPEKD